MAGEQVDLSTPDGVAVKRSALFLSFSIQLWMFFVQLFDEFGVLLTVLVVFAADGLFGCGGTHIGIAVLVTR